MVELLFFTWLIFIFLMLWIALSLPSFIWYGFTGVFSKRLRKWIRGQGYATCQAHKIHGVVKDDIIEGQLAMWSQSLWKTYDSEFFLLTFDEIHGVKWELLTSGEARQWIFRHTHLRHAKNLVREWFGMIPNSCLFDQKKEFINRRSC